jgi:hypothetical protein
MLIVEDEPLAQAFERVGALVTTTNTLRLVFSKLAVTPRKRLRGNLPRT